MKHKTVLVLVSGDRCGKDTVALLIKKELLKKVNIYPLARKLKTQVSELLNIDEETVDRYKNTKEPIIVGDYKQTMRDFLKRVATFTKKLVSKYFYVEDVYKSIVCSEADVYIIPDLRFKEEHEFITKEFKKSNLDVKFVKINSDLKNCTESTIDKEVKVDYDYIINNNRGDFDSLKICIRNLIEELELN